jgi:hypothetical protein
MLSEQKEGEAVGASPFVRLKAHCAFGKDYGKTIFDYR